MGMAASCRKRICRELKGGLPRYLLQKFQNQCPEAWWINEVLNEGIREGIKSLLVYIEEIPGGRIMSIAAEIDKPARTIE